MKKNISNCNVADIRYVIKFLIRTNIIRDTMIPFTIVDKPGSVNTILAADRAASVAPETATPTSARFNAGAS
jgi:hypothetical protein